MNESAPVLFFQNVAAPYRQDFFRALSRLQTLFVFFGTAETDGRPYWSRSADSAFAHAFGKGRMIRLRNRCFQPYSGVLRHLGLIAPRAVVSITARANAFDVHRLWRHCRARSIPFLVWYAGEAKGGGNGILNRICDRFIGEAVAGADGAVFYTEYARTCAERLGFRGPSMVGGQILDDGFQSCRRTPKTGDAIRLLYVGSFNRRKGLDALVERLDRDWPRAVELHLIGGTEAELSALLPNWRHVRHPIRCHGTVARETLGARYAESDIVVLPSRYDPWGFVVNEAMACGVPVLCSRAAGAHVLAEKGGWTFDADDDASFDAALIRALNECRDVAPDGLADAQATHADLDDFVARFAGLIDTIDARRKEG